MASQAVLFRRKKNLASEDCAFFYCLRKCKRSLSEIIEIAERERNPEYLYHLVTCDDCRMHVQERDPSSFEAEKIVLLCAAINRIEQMIERRNEARSLRIQRNLARAQTR
ncbi:MAG: hypothetical protein ABR884_02370 [Minisyncoccia bacterium]|jgi:hypothetical protein